jgi:hypothetical protein
MQKLLHKAYERKKMMDNITESANKLRSKQLNQRGVLLESEDINRKFPPLSIVLLKTDVSRSKVDKRSPNLGPFFVISQHKNVINMMELKTGKILRRSYRNVVNLLPSDKILSMGAFPNWLDNHPRSIVDNDTTTSTISPQEATEEYKTALGNIADLYTFLTPVLPSVADTERTITLYKKAGREENNRKNKLDNTMTTEEGDLDKEMDTEDQEVDEMEEASSSEEEEGEEAESDEEVNDEKQVTFDMGHLSEEEKEKEDKRMETDVAYEIAPGINIHVPCDEFDPTPSIQPQGTHKKKKKEIVIREPRRSSRPRTLPARLRD